MTVRLDKAQVGDPAKLDPGKESTRRLSRLHGQARVLLVEDEAASQEVGMSLLTEAGLAPDLATNGLEAPRLVTLNDFDLILMDIQMSEMDGLAATRAIRALPERSTTPILALTRYAFDTDRQACMDEGMDCFIAKPIEPNSLYAIVLDWLSRLPKSPPRRRPLCGQQPRLGWPPRWPKGRWPA